MKTMLRDLSPDNRARETPPATTGASRQMPLPDDASSADAIQILIADDHAVMREGLKALLAPHSDFSVVGEAQNGCDALRLAAELGPDVMLLDCSLPDLSALDVMRAMHSSGFRAPRTILLNAPLDTFDVVSFLRWGGRGVLVKETSTAMIFKSIRKVHRGEVWIGRETIADILGALVSGEAAEPNPPTAVGLTRREGEVLQLVFEGETNKGIANRLAVAEDTIKHHLTNIFDKTGVSNRLELVRFALHHRLLSAD